MLRMESVVVPSLWADFLLLNVAATGDVTAGYPPLPPDVTLVPLCPVTLFRMED
jgi:hypothetical protein